MPEFAYVAKKGPVEVVKGSLAAATQREAIRMIEGQGLVPIEVSALDRASAAAEPPSPAPKARGGRIPAYPICVFTRQLAGFMRSNVPLLTALELIREQTRPGRLRDVIGAAAQRVREGGLFSEALDELAPESFDRRYTHMLRAGEAGGSLEQVLDALADHLERDEEAAGQVRAAMAYPAFVMAVGAGTVFFLFAFCVPRLAGLFAEHRASLPLPTRMLLATSAPAGQAVLWTVFGALAAAALYLARGGRRGRRLLEKLLSRLPVLGEARVKADVARFSATLAMLVRSGVPVYRAIEFARSVLTDELLREELRDAHRRLLAGETLRAVLCDARRFPGFASRMVAVGEDSGRLPESLEELARFYQRESLRSMKAATSLLEPILILSLSLIVGIVVAGIMLPVFDLSWIR